MDFEKQFNDVNKIREEYNDRLENYIEIVKSIEKEIKDKKKQEKLKE